MSNSTKKIGHYGNNNISIPKEKKEEFISSEKITKVEVMPDINAALQVLKISRKRK